MPAEHFTTKGSIVWGIAALFFLYEFFLRTVMGTYQHPIMYDLNLSSFQFSVLSTTLFLFIYGLMQIPVGLIVDTIGLKKSLFLGTATCTLASVSFAYSTSFLAAMMCRMLMGFGASFGFICLLIAVHEWVPHRYNAIGIGFSQFVGTLGPMLAAGPLEQMSESSCVTWRFIFFLLGIIGASLSALTLFFVENNRTKTEQYTILYRPESLWRSIKRLFLRAQPWWIALATTSLYFTIEYLSENEGRTFLQCKGIPLHTAAYMISAAWIGYALSCPLLGFISDYYKRRKIILTSCALLSLCATIAIVYAANPSLLYLSFFALGVAAGSQSVSFATVSEQFKKQFIAVGFGLTNAVIMTMAAINAPIIGMLLDYVKQTEHNTLFEYQQVFSILILIAALGLIISAKYIKETYGKSAVDFTYLNTEKSLIPEEQDQKNP